jgi:hypothetical protein
MPARAAFQVVALPKGGLVRCNFNQLVKKNLVFVSGFLMLSIGQQVENSK